MAKLDIERDIKINGYQPVVCGDNEVGDIFDYYVKRYGISNLYFIRKHEIIRIYESSIIFDTIAPNQGGIAYE